MDDSDHTLDLEVQSVFGNVEFSFVTIKKYDSSVVENFPTFGVKIFATFADRCEFHRSEELFHKIIEKVEWQEGVTLFGGA